MITQKADPAIDRHKNYYNPIYLQGKGTANFFYNHQCNQIGINHREQLHQYYQWFPVSKQLPMLNLCVYNQLWLNSSSIVLIFCN